MKDFIIDCSLGISSDMLLSSLYNLGLPKDFIQSNINNLKLDLRIKPKMSFQKCQNHGISGIKTFSQISFEGGFSRKWIDIQELIANSLLSKLVKDKALEIFRMLAKAEASVHGVSAEEIHFHEIGSLESVVEIVCICAAFQYFSPQKTYYVSPPAGSGKVNTSHGLLPIPVPTVIEIARRYQIPLCSASKSLLGELTTPTGIALIAVLGDQIGYPKSLRIRNVGVGLGHKDLDRPNFLRVLEIDSDPEQKSNSKSMIRQLIVLQEAWIDDATPEEISVLLGQLRKSGAIDVTCSPIQMKKNRPGISIRAIVHPKDAERMRLIWFSHSSSLGLREREEARWVLPRRTGKCITPFGEIAYKQSWHPNGQLRTKPENDELIRISGETGKTIDEIKSALVTYPLEFLASEDWSS